jgi:hypothetical protein
MNGNENLMAKEPSLREVVSEIAEMLSETEKQLSEARSKIYRPRPENCEGKNPLSGDSSLESGIDAIRYFAMCVRDQAIEVNSRI